MAGRKQLLRISDMLLVFWKHITLIAAHERIQRYLPRLWFANHPSFFCFTSQRPVLSLVDVRERGVRGVRGVGEARGEASGRFGSKAFLKAFLSSSSHGKKHGKDLGRNVTC